MANEINTSFAQTVIVDLNDIDPVPMALLYQDNTVPSAPVNIDLTNYAFSIRLETLSNLQIKTYSIAAGSLTSTFLTKSGINNATLLTGAMWTDIQTLVQFGNNYRLLQVVTDPSLNSYVHIIYIINADRY